MAELGKKYILFEVRTFEKKRFKCLAIQPCSLAAPPPHLLGDVGPSGAPPHLSVVVVAQYHAASGPRLGPPRNPSRAPWRKGSHPGPQARFQQHSIIYSCFVCVSASLWCPRSLPLSDPVMCSPKSPLPPPRLPMSRPPLPCLPRFARRDTHLDTDRYPPWWPCGSPSQAGEHPFPSLISLANMAITPPHVTSTHRPQHHACEDRLVVLVEMSNLGFSAVSALRVAR